MTQNWMETLFGTVKPVIGMVHFPALPGAPLYDGQGGLEAIIESVSRDVANLQQGGVDAVMFCNENDRPYELEVGPATVATMAYVIGAVRSALRVPMGVDILWDPVATVALGHATQAHFAREVFTGLYASDMGVWNSRAAEALRLRAQLGDARRLRLLFNVSAEFASPLGNRTPGELARSVTLSSLPDALCVSGPLTGSTVAMDDLTAVREAVPQVPIFVNTGVSAENAERYLRVADGAIVGTAFKENGETFNPVDVSRVKHVMAVVHRARQQS